MSLVFIDGRSSRPIHNGLQLLLIQLKGKLQRTIKKNANKGGKTFVYSFLLRKLYSHLIITIQVCNFGDLDVGCWLLVIMRIQLLCCAPARNKRYRVSFSCAIHLPSHLLLPVVVRLSKSLIELDKCDVRE